MPNIDQEVVFKYGTQDAYDGLASPRNTNTIFFTDEGRMFIGDEEYTNQILLGSSLPNKTTSPKSLFILKASDGHYEFYYSSTGKVGSWTLVYSTDSVPDGVVRYDMTQSLSSSQKTKAMKNIGAASAANLTRHTSNKNNPHSVTKSQIGLGNVDNTSDSDKPVSSDQKTYIDGKFDDAVQKIDDIVIGGTNLLLDTDAPSLTKIAADYDRFFTSPIDGVNATAEFLQVDDSPCSTKNILRISIINAQPNSGTTVAGLRFYNHTGPMPLGISFIPGEQYTMSCYARKTSGAPKINMTMWGLTAWGWHDVPEEWTKFSLTFKATEDFNSKTSAWAVFSAHKSYVGTLEMTGFQIEKGNKATDWSPAPEDLESQVNHLQVGGRNLLLDTDAPSLTKVFAKSNRRFSVLINGEDIIGTFKTITDSPCSTKNSVSIKVVNPRSGDPDPVYLVFYNKTKTNAAEVNFIPGNTYTISCYARAVSGSPKVNLTIYRLTGFDTVPVTNDWSLVSFNFVATESFNTVTSAWACFGVKPDSVCEVEMTGFKLEKGSIPTDWTPAPEEVPENKNLVTSEGGAQITMDPSLGSGPYTINMNEEDEGDLTALQVSYNNVSTGMTSTNVQDAIGELFQSVSEGKSLVAAAVTDKGVETAADASFSEIADNISKISSSSGIGSSLGKFILQEGGSLIIPSFEVESALCLVAQSVGGTRTLVSMGQRGTFNLWISSVVSSSSITYNQEGMLVDDAGDVVWVIDPDANLSSGAEFYIYQIK